MANLKEAVLLFIFGLILSLITIEFASNVFPLFQTDIKFIAEGMDKDDYLFSKFKPIDVNYSSADLEKYNVKTNPLGINNYYIRDSTPTEDVFGVAIGDSFTYCAEINIEDCWVNILEKRVGKDMVNLGGPGQFSITEERILTDYGLPLKPKVVVWQFMTNDISDTAYFKYNDTLPPFYELRKFFNGRSNVYILIKKMVNPIIYSQNAPLSFEINGIRNTFNHIDASKNTNNFCNSEISIQVKEAILRSKEKTEDIGSKFLIVMIPMKEEIYIEKFNKHLGTNYDFSCPIREIKEFAEAKGIAYIDMTEHFKESVADGGIPYLNIGGHLSAEGNKLMADIIYDYLVR